MTTETASQSVHRVEREIQGRTIAFESGLIAKQANGACTVRMGETVVFAAATAGEVRPVDFMPLMVDYREKTSAAGKFPGGFIKRESRPGDTQTLVARLTDRPLRPLFPENWIYDTQVLCQVFSFDQENPTDALVMNAASAAVHVSDITFAGPVGSLRVGRADGAFIAFPTHEQIDESDLDLIVSATREGIIMVEAGADEISEEDMLAAFEFALPHIQTLIEMQEELRERAGRQKKDWELRGMPENLYPKVKEYEGKIRDMYFTPGKKAWNDAFRAIRKEMLDTLCPKDADGKPVPGSPKESDLQKAWEKLTDEVVRDFALQGKRADGRGLDEVRPISVEVGLLPRTHGSALFTRGETQALVTTTLGTGDDEQIIDGLQEEYSKNFMLHYYFPPFSVGETKAIRGPGRREIGHGALAERALLPVMPEEEKFPYTVRVISDIMESNGSSSMASVCGGALALMDAGVPIRKPVAGVAMGLIYEDDDRVAILTDIIGSEDAHGDMDFKVAGTEDGITALQMDLKAAGIPMTIVRKALAQAHEGRMHILGRMRDVIAEPRSEMSKYAPRHVALKINPEKIGLIIGPGGKTIRGMEEESGATIEVEDDGSVMIYAASLEELEKAESMVKLLTEELSIGTIYKATVVSIKDFGAFVDLEGRGREGLVHVTEITDAYVDRVDDYLERGMEVEVKLISREDSGKYRFSLKAARQERGQEPLGRLDGQPPKPRPERSDRGGDRRFRDSRPRGGSRGGPRGGPRGGGRDRGGPPRREGGGGKDPRDF
ncbi:MAG: polyribonucleotide nucleotidyltransferase [Planctomycetota bacterium]